MLADKASVEENKRATIERRASVAECLIKEFLHEATRLFGPEHINYKFHELLHLPQNYRDFQTSLCSISVCARRKPETDEGDDSR